MTALIVHNMKVSLRKKYDWFHVFELETCYLNFCSEFKLICSEKFSSFRFFSV
jgi:hypothetical protein